MTYGAVDAARGFADAAIEAIRRRVENIEGTTLANEVKAMLESRRDEWASRASKTPTLVYRRKGRDDTSVPLLKSPEEREWEVFTCLNSLRDVEPSSSVVLIEDATRP